MAYSHKHDRSKRRLTRPSDFRWLSRQRYQWSVISGNVTSEGEAPKWEGEMCSCKQLSHCLWSHAHSCPAAGWTQTRDGWDSTPDSPPYKNTNWSRSWDYAALFAFTAGLAPGVTACFQVELHNRKLLSSTITRSRMQEEHKFKLKAASCCVHTECYCQVAKKKR